MTSYFQDGGADACVGVFQNDIVAVILTIVFVSLGKMITE